MGKQFYGVVDLLNFKFDKFGEIVVMCFFEQVFYLVMFVFFEGMSIMILYLEDENGNVWLVNFENWKEFVVGYFQNVWCGIGEQFDLMLVDFIVKDESVIQFIEDGLCEVLCGYDVEYEQVELGKVEQVDIIGNYVVFVFKGRVGNCCIIGDRDIMVN